MVLPLDWTLMPSVVLATVNVLVGSRPMMLPWMIWVAGPAARNTPRKALPLITLPMSRLVPPWLLKLTPSEPLAIAAVPAALSPPSCPGSASPTCRRR